MLVPTTYKQLQKTRLKIKSALVSSRVSLPASLGFIGHIPNIFFNSPCRFLQNSWSFFN